MKYPLDLPLEDGKEYVLRNGVIVKAVSSNDPTVVGLFNTEGLYARAVASTGKQWGNLPGRKSDVDVVANYDHTKTPGHIHAALIMEAATLAQTNPKFWEEFEWWTNSAYWVDGVKKTGWCQCAYPPEWSPDVQYRRRVKGCEHAAEMLQYAQDAQTMEKPWEQWLMNIGTSDWQNLSNHPRWRPNTRYLRK